ncbi:hypothetical protein Tco_0516069 [Tanacetum coccineum]
MSNSLSVGGLNGFFINQLLVFQQHQDESLYDSWTCFNDIIQKVPNHGLSIWTLIEIFHKHLDPLSRYIVNLTTKGDLRKFSDIGAWYTIVDCVQYDKKCSNPTSIIFDETIANPNAQIVGDDMVRENDLWHGKWLMFDEKKLWSSRVSLDKIPWSMTMRNQTDVDTLSMMTYNNNLRFLSRNSQAPSKSSAMAQNAAFVSPQQEHHY